MKGFYLYCIRGQSGPKISGKGIDGEGEIFTVPSRGLEAVVCKVSLEKFSSEKIQKKAKEDLRWIKEKAQFHEMVVEQAMNPVRNAISNGVKKGNKIESVIPMKFGTIFKTKEKLEETLEKHHSEFKETLENLAGKQEWAVKVYLTRKAFEKEIRKTNEVVQEKEKEIGSLPEGMAYFVQRQVEEVVSREVAQALQNYRERFFEALKRYALTATKGKILERELTGKSLPMVLNAIFLVSEERVEGFVKEINNLAQEFKTKGFSFEYSGPWPPYNFI